MYSLLFVSVIFSRLFLINSCNQPIDIEQLKQELIKTDKTMSELAIQEGFY